MTKRIITSALAALAAFVAFILLTVWTKWGWNPSEWHEEGRALFGAVALFVPIAVGTLTYAGWEE